MVKRYKAIFLDRDGTLIKSIKKTNTKTKTRPPYKKSELHIFNDIKFLKKYEKKYYFFIVTNQPDIKRGLQTNEFDNYINEQLKKKIKIREIFSCKCLKIDRNCKCYKPNIFMLLKAKRKYRIDFEKSFMIGDTWRDIKMGNDCMCKTILIERNKLKTKKIIYRYKANFKIKTFKELTKIL